MPERCLIELTGFLLRINSVEVCQRGAKPPTPNHAVVFLDPGDPFLHLSEPSVRLINSAPATHLTTPVQQAPSEKIIDKIARRRRRRMHKSHRHRNNQIRGHWQVANTIRAR
jgi:hypothetical protein